MVDERAHLAQVDRHIAETKEHIRKQEQLIARLTARGRNLDEAEHFLSVLGGTLKVLKQQRLLILDRL
jgi:ferritin-like metal-binding protein YciE